MRKQNAFKCNPNSRQEQMEGQYFLSTAMTPGVFVTLFWNNGLSSIACSVCPYVSRKKERRKG